MEDMDMEIDTEETEPHSTLLEVPIFGYSLRTLF
jgi:hypothetical protein